MDSEASAAAAAAPPGRAAAAELLAPPFVEGWLPRGDAGRRFSEFGRGLLASFVATTPAAFVEAPPTTTSRSRLLVEEDILRVCGRMCPVTIWGDLLSKSVQRLLDRAVADVR